MADEKGATMVQVDAERLAKLAKYEESVKKATEKANRKVAGDKILVAKALKAGITVTEAEIDALMALRAKKK